jgi:hypothetical protein
METIASETVFPQLYLRLEALHRNGFRQIFPLHTNFAVLNSEARTDGTLNTRETISRLNNILSWDIRK